MLIHTPTHTWLKNLHVSYVPGRAHGLADHVASELMEYLEHEGHTPQDLPSGPTDVILTTANAGDPLGWRDSLMFTARRRYKLDHAPTVLTIVAARPEDFDRWIRAIEEMLEKGGANPDFAGIPETAEKTLFQQGKRGGAILYLSRVLQIQAKCIRLLLVVGTDQPESAYLFDLVGAHPRLPFENAESFYTDLVTRIATAVSTTEITNHSAVEPPIPHDVWTSLPAVSQMLRASREFGRRDFFTEMIKVANLAEIPGFSEAISSQYSEGCFATWEPALHGLVTTITGSARPVNKDHISDEDLAVIVGIKPEHDGALIRHIEGHPNHPPSSEAVEMVGMDQGLPRLGLPGGGEAPVIRSKLHGHRSIRSYDPARVEYVALADSYLHYPVSCSTDAQYRAIQQAFGNSEALRNPDDPRQVVFTVLPGHGTVIVEKWVEGKDAFQAIWETMDRGDIEITNDVPQGPFEFRSTGGRFVAADGAHSP